MDYFNYVLGIYVAANVYLVLLVIKVVFMKLEEDRLREAGKAERLKMFMKKKTFKHIFSLGIF